MLSSFDELLKNLNYGVLYTNLTKLLFFLESDNKKCIFHLTKDYEEFFEMIVQDINILKSKSLDDDYSHISNKIIKAAAGKLLFYVFEYKLGFHKKVMVITKVPLMDQSGNSTASISWSSMPPSPASTKVDTNAQSRSLFPAGITPGFKIHCLRTMLVFIKNDAVKTKEFPELNTDQAKFMHLLLRKVNIVDFDSNCEVKELYRELVHAVKINELKYEFRIKCIESWGGKKSVVFEKVPVHISPAVSSDQTADKSKQSVVFDKIPVPISPGTALSSDQTTGKSKQIITPKKPKVNVQNALRLAATDNIKLDKVINLNQSLRSKKKDKKRKKAELKKANKSKGASVSSCSSCSTSRDSSWDRMAVAAAHVPKVPKRPSNEISQSPKKTYPSRLTGDTLRNEKLKEAMSVPVQSDKAMRMMLGMGWNGGALGTRGDGITEPLMPALEITRGAGFGLTSHRTQNSNQVPVPKKPKKPNSTPFVPGRDIVVRKMKQPLLEDVAFDTGMDTTEPAKLNVELQKANVKPSKPTTPKVDPPTQTRFSTELQKPENADMKLRLPFRLEILHSIWDLINSDASCKSLKYDTRMNKKQRKFVNFTMQTLSSKKDATLCTFTHEEITICKQIRNKYADIEFAVEARFFWDYRSIDLLKIPKNFNPPTHTVLENKENTAAITNDTQIINSENLLSYIFSMNGKSCNTQKTIKNMQFKVLFLINMLKFVKSLNEEWEVIFNKVLNAKEKLYMENVVDQINMRIKFGSTPAETKLGDQIRENVKDAFLGVMYNHEHKIITLSKYYRFKRLNRPDNAVRRKAQATFNFDDFTSETLSEPKLNTAEPIDKEIQYDDGKVKYEVSEDTNEVRETDNIQVSTENTTTSVSDDETSEALPISNELGPYASDDSSVEEYNNNNANAKVPKLLPGEEGVNISNFLYLYDTEKTNTAGFRNNSIINNESASIVKENRNSKNNSGNGNVVIDNNDNQFIDMKRDGGNARDTQKEKNVDSEKVEYVVCVDYKEEVLKSAEISIQIDRKEINLPENVKEGEENDQATTKHSDTAVANDAKIVNACKDIGDGDILQINDEVILNTEDLDPNVIVIGDSDSDNNCTENKAKDKIKNITENLPLEDFKGETDVIMKDITDVKTIKIINITEDLMEGINIEPVIKEDESKIVINLDDSMAIINLDDASDVINKDESEFVIIQGESMERFNTVESSKDVKIAQIIEGTSINPSDETIVKDDLVLKSDCDRIVKENIVLSEQFCNTQSVESSNVKTVGSGTNFLCDNDSEIKNVRIGHTHHPIRKLSTEKVKTIQWHISNCIRLATELPLLKCHGVQNGALFYTCHNKKTYDWLQNTIGVASYAKVFDIKEVTKMALKLCGYFDFDSNYLFKMLEMYNKEISTKEWVVEKTEKNGDYILFIVKMDKFSIKFIQESELALFAGIDKVHFSLIWE